MKPYVACEHGCKIAELTERDIRVAKRPEHLLDILAKRKGISRWGRCECGGKFYEPGRGFLKLRAPRALHKTAD